jgi:hypothetical protein
LGKLKLPVLETVLKRLELPRLFERGGSFNSSGFVEAEETRLVDLAMGKGWTRALLASAFLKGDGLAKAEINSVLDEAFTHSRGH